MKTDEKKHTLGKRLVHKITCPNCWHLFPPEEILFIAKHPELIGDAVAGRNEFRRFLPKRFTINCQALDERGLPTGDMACPRCHLQIPEAMLETYPLFISFAGAPASGKSYYLTTLSWELRKLFPKLALSFTDADPASNIHIQTNEHLLFMNPRPDMPTEIPKTQTDDPHLHKTVLLNRNPVRFPIPLQFTLWPAPQHPEYKEAHKIGRILVLYDNAGEDFLPSMEDSNSAVIQHLSRSKILMFLFDPTQDARFRRLCNPEDPQIKHGLRPGRETNVIVRQETLLREMTVKIRTYLNLSQSQRIQTPLLILLPKFDVWTGTVDISIDREPYTVTPSGEFMVQMSRIEEVSEKLRRLIGEYCPELVATADNLSTVVRYFPVSSLGTSPAVIEDNHHLFYGIRPAVIQPRWVTVPLLYSLCKWAPVTMSHIKRT